jgi:prepilin-type N-terminal cleavage/methylation domain-containing protein
MISVFKTSFTENAFTLVELLIVISIMAILAVTAVTFFGYIQSDARDSKRKAELNAIATTLEINKSADSSSYSPLVPNMFGSLVFPGGVTMEALDPSGYPYCIAVSTTSIPPIYLPSDLNTVTNWSNLIGSTSCPTNPTGWSKITGSQPDGSSNAWTICTRLENRGSPTSLCLSNQQ